MKKIIALLLVLTMALSLTACESSTSLTINVSTGDEIKVTCDTSEDYSMKWDSDDDELIVKDDGDTVLNLIFLEEDGFCEGLSGNVHIKEDDEDNGLRYIVFTPDDEDVYYVVGWIVGSETGVFAEGTDSKKETVNALNALTFKAKDTDEDDEDYYPDILDELEDYIEEPVDEPDVPDEPDVTDPDVTEPPVDDTKPTETDPVETDPIETKPVDGMSNDWKDFTIAYQGNVIKLPYSYKDFKELTGLTMKSSEEKSYLEPNYYTVVTLKNADGNSVCAVSVLNNTDEDATYADCMIIEISQYDMHVDHSEAIVFSGLKIGDITSKAELIALFGEPTDTFEYRIDEDDDQEWKKYESDTYTWCMHNDWTTMDNFEIKMNINTGVIEEISTDCSGLID